MKNRILILLLFITSTAVSQIHMVKQDGSGDYTTIQSAVDAAGNGDTVLVWPGTWYENVKIVGKNISLGSLTLTTGDLSYIDQTTINGNFNGSCIELKNCQDTNLINGFSLTKGSGSYHGSIGGGGMSVDKAPASIVNCKIFENQVTGRGGGIYIEDTWVFLSNTSVHNNHAFKSGGGINMITSDVVLDTNNLCNIFLNYSSKGTDISKGGANPLHIVVDTFTVMEPDYYYLYSVNGFPIPQNDITFHILNSKINQVSQDLFVSPQGSNNNSGTSINEPLKNLYFALLKIKSDSIAPKTIYLANGIYSFSTGEKFPISPKKHINIQGEDKQNCILDGMDSIYLIHGIFFADYYSFSYLSLVNGNGNKNSVLGNGAFYLEENNNSTFSNIMISDNKGWSASGGTVGISNNFNMINVTFDNNFGGAALNISSFNHDSVYIKGNIFKNNYHADTGFGGAVAINGNHFDKHLNCFFYNCLFAENHTKDHLWAGANSLAVSSGSKTYLINCTLGNNSSDNDLGANIGITYSSTLYIYNSILYNNYPSEIYMFNNNSGQNKLEVYNSLVQGGKEDIRILTSNNVLYYDQSNIDADPIWDTSSFYPYSLSYGSPCINTGTLDLPPGVELPETDLAGNPRVWDGQIDMGAYEYGPWVGVDYRPPAPPAPQISAAPNPFYYETSITYKVKEKGKQQIRVYDLRGNHVATLLDVSGQPGSGSIRWNASDSYGNELPAGVYLVELIVNGESKGSVKVVKR